MPDLLDYFTIGQSIACKVISIGNNNTTDNNTESTNDNTTNQNYNTSSKRIDVTVNPEKVWSHMPHSSWIKGTLVDGIVESKQDYGWSIRLSPVTTGFLKSTATSTTTATTATTTELSSAAEYKIGSLIKVIIHDTSSSILKLGLPEQGKKTMINAHDAALVPIDQIVPGSLVPAKISEISDSGIELNLFGLFDATIEASHIPALDWENEYQLGQKVSARVLWVDTINKIVNLSLLPHLIDLVPFTFTLSMGDIAQVQVVRADSKIGLFVKVLNDDNDKVKNSKVKNGKSKKDKAKKDATCTGYVHISKIKDTRIAKIDDAYSAGTTHKARVIGLDYCNAQLILSLQPRVLAQPFVCLQDISVASMVKGVVEKVESFGVIVSITDHIKGLCPTLHLSDATLSHPEKLFRVGSTMSFRVLSCDPTKNRLILTHKKSLVRLEEQKIMMDYEKIQPGDQAMGVVASIQSYGAIINFFNEVRALAPISELSTDYTQNPLEVVKVGMTVSCRVLTVDPLESKMRVSLKTSQIKNSNQLELGSLVSATFLSTSRKGVVVALGQEGNLATIPSTHLCDSVSMSLSLFEALKKPNAKKGIAMGQVMVVSIDRVKGTIEATLKMAGDQIGLESVRQDLNQFEKGQILGGVVSNITERMCFIRFGKMTGVASVHNASDGFLQSISDQYVLGQSVVGVITMVDKSQDRMQVSLKQSMIGNEPKSYDLEIQSLQSLFHARKLLAMVEGKDSGEWVKKVVIGSVVLGKVTRILPVGFEVSLASKVTGLVLGQEKVVEMGQQISCKVIDIDISSRIVDLKIVEEGGMELDVSREAIDQVITSQTTVEGVIENTKEAYSIIKVPSLGNLIAFCASRSLNSSVNAPPRYKTGQKVNVTLVKSVDSDVSRVLACFVVKEEVKSVKNGDSRRLIKNPVDPSVSSLDDILFGKIIKAKIQSVKDMQLNIRLGDNLRGRVHLTQIYDSFNDIPNQIKPLESFKNGDEIVCKVMGFHSLKTHKFLPITHTNPTSQIGVELSIKPSFLGNASMTEESISEINLGPGSFHIGFIQNIEQDCLWVQVGPTTLGRVDCLFISDKVEVLENISKNFKIGQAVTCSVLSFNSEKGRLDLSLVFDRELTLLKKVCVKITQINPAVGLSVSLGSQKYGRIEVSDLYDTCRENPTEAFKIGQILKATIVGIQGSRIDLSLREKIMEVKDLENGGIVEGYVRSISDKGCFVSLFYNSTGRVKISEMSDLYIKDWKSIYKVGQLVKGKITNLDLNKNQIELSLKESMIDPKMKLLDFSDLKLKSVMSGTVKKIEAFGLFIQLDQTNIRGLCHISEAAENPVKNLEKLYSVDDRVRAYVLKIDVENRKVSLSLKASYFTTDHLRQEKGDEMQVENIDMKSSESESEEEGDDDIDSETYEAADSEMQVDLESEVAEESADESDSDSEEENDDQVVDISKLKSTKPLSVDFSWNDDVTMKNESSDESSSDEDQDDLEIHNEKSKRAKKQEKLNRIKEIEKEEELLLDTSREPEMPEDFERLLLGSPNDSFLWIKYMAFQLELAEIEKARSVAERALNSINFREEGEKLNVIVAYLNLENKFGTPESLSRTFEKACQLHDPKKIHIQMVEIYSQNSQFELAEELHKKMVKKFSASCKIWLGYASFLVKTNNPDVARETLKRALQALPHRKHVKLLLKFGQVEFKQGSPERARTVFEGLIGKYSKKPDIWSIYLDMEVRIGNVDVCRISYRAGRYYSGFTVKRVQIYMGVPKFFRWISERYPLCSELIGKNRIPEFDNLYLDMNGIIHNCSHPNDDDPLFRITETQIFISIFSYIDNVFNTIKPKKVFLMAVDGVAPRAKMNQQRARRFRSAMEAKQKAEKAEKAGTILPKEAAFDSNCITPGTPFMDRLQAQLKYYINKKISEDSAWREITVILSGHDVPGEGEHKIMEYIRNSKAAPGYNPNVRHCLYGLDADLVMLGLLSHEPHFSLLREEVSFGRKPKRVTKTAGEQNFYLLHLSLIREYLGFEFQSLQETLSFPYDFERILDDFILICFFVGNDFLPHLPGLHINEGGLATLFEIYKTILPQCSGYLNDNGKLNVHHCQLFFSKLEELETEEFTNFKGDSSWLQGKKISNSTPKKSKLLLSKKQEELFESIKFFLQQPRSSATLQLNWSKTPAGDREFLLQLISAVGLIHSIEAGEDYTMLEIGWDEDDDESDEESNEARARIIKKYEMADRQIIKSKKEELADKQIAFEEAKSNWKKDYYREKLEFTADYEENLSRLVYSYVEGLQWVLFYYYHGVASWEWFFPYHYGPKISDLKSISKLEFNFELGDPFFPFEQLMAVLPPLSKQHVPPSLQDLMTDIHSPIIDFYPTSFKLDMNGKQAEWEAIVKIPFIDEKRLLKAVRGRQKMLTADERRRNARGTDFLFVHSRGPIATHYPSPLPSVFPDIFACYCVMNVFRTIPKPSDVAINKLNENALLGKNLLPGFPSLYTLQFTSSLGHHGVNVFNSDSKNPSHILTLEISLDETPEEKAMKLIGSTIYSDWPFLIESHVLQVADEFFVYEKKKVKEKEIIIKTPHTEQTLAKFAQSVERSEKFYSKRFGVIIGVVDMVAKIESLVGMQLLTDGSVVKEFKVLSEFDTPIQLLVMDDHHDPRFDERPRPPIHIEFPEGSIVFFLSPKLYGTLCEVSHSGVDSNDSVTLKVNLPSSPEFQIENPMPSKIAKNERDILQYYPGWQIAKRLRLSAYTLSRIASNFQITLQESHQKLNIGLCLKFESKGLKVLGYTRKGEKGWEYSQKALDLIEDYRKTFPMILEKIERGGNTDFFLDVDFFPSDTKDYIVQIQKWLAQKGIKQLLAVPLNSVSLTKETVTEIESNVEEYNQLLSLQEFDPVLINSVPRKNILKPSHSIFRLIHQTFELGDRVISTVDFGNVPIAAKGTVVGMEKDKLDICWDFPFMYATTLDGLCGSPRGSSVEKTTVLNLTNIQPPYALGKKLQIPKGKQKVVPPPRPPSNRWDKGVPKPIASEQLQMESMLKTMLHINPADNSGMYGTQHAYQVGPSDTWQPPGMISAPHFMDPHAPAFVPQGPTSYDSSWRPPVPLASSGPPGTYDEMANQLMSILHAHPQTNTTNLSHSNQGQNEKNIRGRGNRGRGRTVKNQNHSSQDSRPDSGVKSDSNPRKFTLKKRGEQ